MPPVIQIVPSWHCTEAHLSQHFMTEHRPIRAYAIRPSPQTHLTKKKPLPFRNGSVLTKKINYLAAMTNFLEFDQNAL